MGYSFISHVGIYLNQTSKTKQVVKDLAKIPNITIAYITAGKYNIFCKIRAKNTTHAKEIIFEIDDIDGVSRTETFISLEQQIDRQITIN